MAWINSATKINGGYLVGKIFNRSPVTVSSWITAPNSSWATMGRVQCSGVDMEDFNVMSIAWLNQLPTDGTTKHVWWAIDVEQDVYYHVSLVMFITKYAISNATMELKLRIFTDESTYTDNDITVGSMNLTWYTSGNMRTTHINPVFKSTYYSGTNYIIIGGYTRNTSAVGRSEAFNGWAVSVANFKTLLGGDIPESELSPEFGEASKPDGYTGKASFDFHSDKVDFPTDPPSIAQLGFINIYKCEINSLAQLGSTIFPDVQSAVDVQDAVSKLTESIWNSRLIDYIISVHCVPTNVTGGTLTDIKVGTRTLVGIMGRPITNEYVTFDFETIHTDDIFTNYIDMFVSCKIFLPFYGYVNLPPEYWNGGDLHIKYKFNVIDGSFMAYIYSKSKFSELESVIGQYGGTACIHIPTTGSNYSAMFSSLIGAGTQALGAVASGNYLGVASSMINVASALGSGGQMQGSGNYNASSSFMSMRRPFLLLESPVPSFSTNYTIENGLPLNVAYPLSSISGFTVIDNPQLHIDCNDEEYNEIVNLLKIGVIF